ncbi:intradiol ring-cleavage dioxygenase [Streptomyces sp. NPDC088387]|uniref:intradiol ring-cleavage dioxygenase n=1 Tax=Streptomyces sp. NPDC088387 TaxID=3365859 RepID=UPI00381B0C66
MADTPGTSPLGRRTVLIATGTAAGLAMAGCVSDSDDLAAPTPSTATPQGTRTPQGTNTAAPTACTLTREATEGPYHLDGTLVRPDLTENKPGIPLDLTLTVVDADTCTPLPKAMVELWHADALGEYSGFVGANGHEEPDNGRFLRGALRTDSAGVAEFRTIYPGWYGDRCVHIHVKVYTDVEPTDDGSFEGGQELHTGQLFFDEKTTAEVAALTEYRANTVRRTPLAEDSFYDNGGAASGLLTLTALGANPGEGYAGSLTLGVEQD